MKRIVCLLLAVATLVRVVVCSTPHLDMPMSPELKFLPLTATGS
jgi:hypothetical protein